MKHFHNSSFVMRFEEQSPTVLSMADVDKAINGAIARLTKDVLPGLMKPLEEKLNSSMASISESLTKLSPQPVPDEKEKEKDKASPELNAKLQNYESQVKLMNDKLTQLEEARKRAEAHALATEKESKIRSVLGGFSFTSPEAAEDAFTLINGQVKHAEDGALIAEIDGAALPYSDYIKSLLTTKKAYLLAPTGRSGAGTERGTQRGKAAPIQLEDIKPGMKPEDLSRVAGEIRAALS